MRIATITLCLFSFCFTTFTSLIAQSSYTEISASAGIDYLVWGPRKMGGGLAFFDYDMDGWEDLYVTGGLRRDMLYHNNGDGTFTEVGLAAGLGATSIQTYGVVSGDIDNDGFREIVITTDSTDANFLFYNNGDGTFTDISASAGIVETDWGYAPAFGDFNHDGLIDLYVGNYIETGRAIFDSITGLAIGYDHDCSENQLYINNGDLTFTEIGMLANVNDDGCALATAFTDFDHDGDVDLLVANDFGEWVSPNGLYRNEFPSVSTLSDVSTPSNMDVQLYSMGIAIADYDHDMDMDYYISNIGGNVLMKNNNDGTFVEDQAAAGVKNEFVNDPLDSILTVGWGTAFMDMDNDTWQDLYVVNGYMGLPMFATSLDDPDKMYRNNGDGTFDDVSSASGLGSTHIGRGFAYSDFDKDGDLDFVVTNIHWDTTTSDRIQFYRNDYAGTNHWINIELEGLACNRDGYGSHIKVVTATDSWLYEINGGSSHASQNSSIAHIGLGTSTSIDSLIIFWPGGGEQVLTSLAADQHLHILEDTTSPLITGIKTPVEGPASNFAAAPNPFQNATTFSFQTLVSEAVTLEVYDIMGRKVRSLIAETLPTGRYQLTWDGTEATGSKAKAGIYITKLTIGERAETLRVVLTN